LADQWVGWDDPPAGHFQHLPPFNTQKGSHGVGIDKWLRLGDWWLGCGISVLVHFLDSAAHTNACTNAEFEANCSYSFSVCTKRLAIPSFS